MNVDLPYSVEYAKSSRSSCKNCKNSIQKDSLRLAVIIQVHNIENININMNLYLITVINY